MKNEELKVGDVVSYLPSGSTFTYCVVKVANEQHLAHLNKILNGSTWMIDIHPSLLPEGFVLVEQSHLESMYSESFDQHAQIEADLKTIQEHKEELEAARVEIERLNRIKYGVVEDLTRLVKAQEYHGLHHEYQDGKATAYAHCIDMLSVDDYL